MYLCHYFANDSKSSCTNALFLFDVLLSYQVVSLFDLCTVFLNQETRGGRICYLEWLSMLFILVLFLQFPEYLEEVVKHTLGAVHKVAVINAQCNP